MDKTVLQVEYDKALKRASEQRAVLKQTEIAASHVELPTLAATAKRRLSKLVETYAETLQLINELESALNIKPLTQVDIEDITKAADQPSVASKKR